MIQSETFGLFKHMAQFPMGIGGKNTFIYWADFKRQWENSYSNTKIMELIGSQSISEYCLPDVWRWLGSLSREEKIISDGFHSLYSDIAKLLSSIKVPVTCETDIAETLLDLRIQKRHIGSSTKVLDIGPGAGRSLIGLCLSDIMHGSVYVGIESIGLPYIFQNMLFSHLWGSGKINNFLRLH